MCTCPLVSCPFTIPPTSYLECRHDGWSSSSLKELSLRMKTLKTKDGRAQTEEAWVHVHCKTTTRAWYHSLPDFSLVYKKTLYHVYAIIPFIFLYVAEANIGCDSSWARINSTSLGFCGICLMKERLRSVQSSFPHSACRGHLNPLQH